MPILLPCLSRTLIRALISAYVGNYRGPKFHKFRINNPIRTHTMAQSGKFQLLCLENPLLDIQGQG